LAGIEVATTEGDTVLLGDIVDRPTIVDVVRYYGCAPCRERLLELAAAHDRIEAGGGAVIGVGPRAAYQARLLAERGGIPFPLVLDPDHGVARAAGLERQPLWRFLFDLRAWWRWLRSFLRVGQGLITGGWWEVPAMIVVDSTCRPVWAHRGRSIGDYPPLDEVLTVLEATIRKETGPARG
jgi:hypothetical protein